VNILGIDRLNQGFSTFFLPFTPCQLPNKTKYCNFSIIKFTPRIGRIYPRLRTPGINGVQLVEHVPPKLVGLVRSDTIEDLKNGIYGLSSLVFGGNG